MREMIFIAAIAAAAAATAASAGEATDIAVSQAWVRATVPGQSATGAYMRIDSTQDVALVGASTAVAARAQLHEMKMNGGMMTMAPVERLDVAPGHALSLDERRYHFMLEGLRRPLKAGEHVALELRFLDASGRERSVAVDALVRELSAHGPPPDAHAATGQP